MNNIFFNLILPLIIIAIFLGVLIYLCFFKKKGKKEHNRLSDAHSTNSSNPAKDVFDFFKENNIEPQFLNHETDDKNE